ncbi:GRAM domain-containing protein 4-like isoform X1 [Branchiostoma floridae]|uniref:GRAM domain-containing protein 4-like isoform X1 n=3 Tax=Branchiostoma floridae TaxID=7739 RepID=A0A9J7MSQ4_BRAFL|nr:GRAM domain-containing protein 4-like isoform X1 [Branchiostoma floridae]
MSQLGMSRIRSRVGKLVGSKEKGRASSLDESSTSSPLLEGNSSVVMLKYHRPRMGSLEDSESVEVISPGPQSPGKTSAQGSVESLPGSEREMYERQLEQLQEQLVAAMIENQNLEKVHTELKKERDKNQELQRRLHDHEYSQEEAPATPSILRRRRPPGDVDPADEALENLDHTNRGVQQHGRQQTEKKHNPTAKVTFLERMMEKVYELMHDFSEVAKEETVQVEQEGDPLTVKKLKENLKRFSTDSKPIWEFGSSLTDLLGWKTPSATFLSFFIYMYFAWQGWLLQFFLFLCILRLSLNYLIAKGWKISFEIIPRRAQPKKEPEESQENVGMADKFQLVLQVARKVQNTLGQVADSLEKLKNLLTWQHPEATRQLYSSLWMAFLASCVIPGQYLVPMFGVGLGIKLFLIDYVFKRFPRVRSKYDNTHRIWQTLPTDLQLKSGSWVVVQGSRSEPYLPIPSTPPPELDASAVVNSAPTSLATTPTGTDTTEFLQLFNLPSTEVPQQEWEDGRHCVLIDRDKGLTSGGIKHGRLYLTKNFLCYERSKSNPSKNVKIQLGDIVGLEKAKALPFMPGNGMSLEVKVNNAEKPYLFGAMINRDEVYDQVLVASRHASQSWTVDEEEDEEEGSS